MSLKIFVATLVLSIGNFAFAETSKSEHCHLYEAKLDAAWNLSRNSNPIDANKIRWTLNTQFFALAYDLDAKQIAAEVSDNLDQLKENLLRAKKGEINGLNELSHAEQMVVKRQLIEHLRQERRKSGQREVDILKSLEVYELELAYFIDCEG